ncbi:MAG TPA: tryptophan synthase subunit alpha [bacterium]|nr:tryptophan synthase subunit alpha [bacterium]
MSRKLQEAFRRARSQKKALFLPYVCLGYPTYALSLKCAKAALRGGAAALELGAPFSDPIADGPTLQKATQVSLDQGTRFSDVFRMVRDLRKEKFQQPLLVMSYLNLVEQMGWKGFAKKLAQAGGDGAIIPDLPLEKFSHYKSLLRQEGLSLIPFIAPTSSPERVKKADAQGSPFLYYVSVTGVTGARKTLAPGLMEILRNLRRRLKTPLVVGFGISSPAQAGRVGKVAHGVIIASALIQLISKTPKARIEKAVEGFCRQVVNALK